MEIKHEGPEDIHFFTDDIERARFDADGNLLINHNDPALSATVDIRARGPFITTMGWNAGLKVSNGAAICFDSDDHDPNNPLGNRYYFTAGPSVNPRGDFWQALYPMPDGSAAPQYIYQVYGQGRQNEPAQGVHRFRTTLLADERIGVNTLFPSQSVEIVNNNGIGLRLTNLQNNQPNLSRATDFQTINTGDLLINPHDGATERRVGINEGTPLTTLHVGGTAGTTGAITADFLNHSATPPAPTGNPWLVYSDGNGTLRNLPVSGNANHVLHGDGSWSSGGNGNVNTGCGTTLINFVPKFCSTTTTIGNSQIFDNGTSVGIGTSSPNPNSRLTVNGDIHLSNFNNGIYLNGSRFLVSDGNGFQNNIYLGIGAGPVTGANNGFGNIVLGNTAGASLSDNELGNVLIGGEAGRTTEGSWPDASNNVFLGWKSGLSNVDGRDNVSVGSWAGSGSDLSSEVHNVFIGRESASWSGWGDHNVFIGSSTQFADRNEYNYSCAIGADARVQGSNSVALGQNSIVQSDNCIVMGNTEATMTLIGYTADPSLGGYRLYVNALSNNEAAYFEGDIFVNGSYNGSDISLKTNVNPLEDLEADSIIGLLNAKTYYYDTISKAHLNLPQGLQYGLIANEVEVVLPGLVKEVTSPPVLDTLGNVVIQSETFKALNYTGLIPLLIEANQSQKNEIKTLKDRLDQLELLILDCCEKKTDESILRQPIKIELRSENSIILNQNDPNPFAEETRVSFTIPEGVMEAKIIFFNKQGNILRTVKIVERGFDELIVYGSDLTSGTYSYTLIADGNVVDTKKMVCVK